MANNIDQQVSRYFTGGRAVVAIGGKVMAFFNNVSWSLRQDKIPVYVLGKFNPVDIVSVSQDTVNISLSGFRTVLEKQDNNNQNPHSSNPYKLGGTNAGMTQLSELFKGDVKFDVTVFDRKNGNVLFKAKNCQVISWSTGVASRGISDLRLDLIGEYIEAVDGTLDNPRKMNDDQLPV